MAGATANDVTGVRSIENVRPSTRSPTSRRTDGTASGPRLTGTVYRRATAATTSPAAGRNPATVASPSNDPSAPAIAVRCAGVSPYATSTGPLTGGSASTVTTLPGSSTPAGTTAATALPSPSAASVLAVSGAASI